MGLSDRENRRKKSVVNSLIDSRDTVSEDKQSVKYKQKAYYITDDIYKAVNLKAAKTGKDKSAIVREALSIYLKDILEELEEERRNN